MTHFIDKKTGISKLPLVVKSTLGEEANASDAIVAIFAGNPGRDVRFLGTGFFIWSGGLLITARHILDDVRNDRMQLDCIWAVHVLRNKTFYIRNFRKSYENKKSDIAVVALDQPQHNVTREVLPNTSLCLFPEMPKVGDIVFTAAYPRTTVLNSGKSTARIQLDRYDGRVAEVYPNGRDRSILPGPSFRTDMHVHAGASGGPVFNANGLVIGINTSSLSSDTSVSFISSIISCMGRLLTGVIYDGIMCDISINNLLSRSDKNSVIIV
jgi:S1-C subfamily serine protease